MTVAHIYATKLFITACIGERHKLSMQVGFVHIPAPPEQVIKHWPEAPCMPLEMTCKALSLITSSQL
ncbi:MAG: hypothetical protein ACR2FS_01970 [Phormidesmis sp.]